MAYRVSLTAPAEADAYAAFERIRGRGSPPCREVAHPFIRSHFWPGHASHPWPRNSRGKRACFSRPPFAVWQRERCVSNYFSCPEGRAAYACPAHLACIPRCHHFCRRGGVTAPFLVSCCQAYFPL